MLDRSVLCVVAAARAAHGYNAPVPVIASGSVNDLADVTRLCAIEAEGVMGAITGRALYEGTLDLSRAQDRADGRG